jgi:hypothetical protein
VSTLYYLGFLQCAGRVSNISPRTSGKCKDGYWDLYKSSDIPIDSAMNRLDNIIATMDPGIYLTYRALQPANRQPSSASGGFVTKFISTMRSAYECTQWEVTPDLEGRAPVSKPGSIMSRSRKRCWTRKRRSTQPSLPPPHHPETSTGFQSPHLPRLLPEGRLVRRCLVVLYLAGHYADLSICQIRIMILKGCWDNQSTY